jgi:hypothetical protein
MTIPSTPLPGSSAVVAAAAQALHSTGLAMLLRDHPVISLAAAGALAAFAAIRARLNRRPRPHDPTRFNNERR